MPMRSTGAATAPVRLAVLLGLVLLALLVRPAPAEAAYEVAGVESGSGSGATTQFFHCAAGPCWYVMVELRDGEGSPVHGNGGKVTSTFSENLIRIECPPANGFTCTSDPWFNWADLGNPGVIDFTPSPLTLPNGWVFKGWGGEDLGGHPCAPPDGAPPGIGPVLMAGGVCRVRHPDVVYGGGDGWCMVATWGPPGNATVGTRSAGDCAVIPGAPIGRPVQVSKAGTGTGTVSSLNAEGGAGWTCGASCTGGGPSMPEGQFVTFTAAAASGSAFAGWSSPDGTADCQPESSTTCGFTMPPQESSVLPRLTATFNLLPPAPPQNTSPPTISGSPFVGSFLSSTTGTWTGNPAPTLTRQWQRCDSAGANCVNIGGATGTSYQLQNADEGSRVRIRIRAQNASGTVDAFSNTTVVVQQPPPDPTPPVNDDPPGIEGTIVVGHELSASPGQWSGFPEPTYTYQWRRCNDATVGSCANIGGQTASTYTLVAADEGKRIRVDVRAENSAGNATATSDPTGVVGSVPQNTSLPTITGTPKVGMSLGASPGTWTGIPAPTFAYQWRRCDATGGSCVSIAGATSPGYLLVAADKGKRLRVAVTGSSTSGQFTATSAPTAAVTAPVAWNTALTSKPPKTTRSKSATFYWSAVRDKKKIFSGFKSQCKLDKGAWAACKPGKTYQRLKVGLHTIRIRAGDGKAWDPTPVVYSWRVKR